MRDRDAHGAALRTTRRITAQQPAAVEEIWAGLNRPQKELSPKYFYDARGSALFDEITRLDEYYPTRTERALLQRRAHEWLEPMTPRSLVELGPGSADKTRLLLDGIPAGGAYVPVDISATYLDDIARTIGRDYPHLRVLPSRSDIATDLAVPSDLPQPVLFAFLGSTIGNFDEHAAVRLLRRIAAAMRPHSRFLMGADLKKDIGVLERAYNDARGLTAEFNRNILRVVNRETGADFEPEAYDHHAYYNVVAERIEMHLVASEHQAVTIPGKGVIAIAPGESIRTEISCKYDRAAVTRLFHAAGLALETWATDDAGFYALAIGTVDTERRAP